MTKLSVKEKQVFSEFCDSILSNPLAYKEICPRYDFKDYSFEYLFYFNRVKIAAFTSSKSLVKVIREIRTEIKLSLPKSDRYVVPTPPIVDFINIQVDVGPEVVDDENYNEPF